MRELMLAVSCCMREWCEEERGISVFYWKRGRIVVYFTCVIRHVYIIFKYSDI